MAYVWTLRTNVNILYNLLNTVYLDELASPTLNGHKPNVLQTQMHKS